MSFRRKKQNSKFALFAERGTRTTIFIGINVAKSLSEFTLYICVIMGYNKDVNKGG